jgi:hypothetical protein
MQNITIENRIARLERQNRALVVALSAGALLMCIGAAVGMRQSRPQCIDAAEFRLLDDHGNPRARFAMSETGPALIFVDGDANTRLKLILDDADGPAMFMTDHNRADRLAMRVQPTGATVAIGDEHGAERVRLATSEVGASIGLFDAQLKNRARFAIDQRGLPTLHFFTPTAVPIVALISTENGPSVAMNDLDGRLMWCMPEGSQRHAAEQVESSDR